MAYLPRIDIRRNNQSRNSWTHTVKSMRLLSQRGIAESRRRNMIEETTMFITINQHQRIAPTGRITAHRLIRSSEEVLPPADRQRRMIAIGMVRPQMRTVLVGRLHDDHLRERVIGFLLNVLV